MVTVVGLQQGVLTVPGTEGLTPSRELVSFDPEAHRRVVPSTPVISVTPALYAPIALPFSYAGWRGLVSLNILSYILTGLLVFLFCRHYASERHTPWIAMGLFLAGGFSIEYAQGVWPHMLSVGLVTAAVFFAARVWTENAQRVAALSGVLIGIAAGIREQNIVLVACLGLLVTLFAKRRSASAAWYAAGLAVPLSVSATIHYLRQGLWHPFPKYIAYADQVAGQVSGNSAFDPFGTFVAKFIDFSFHADFTDPVLSVLYRKNLDSGAFLIDGAVKKALLQSAPWIGLAVVVLIAVWFVRGEGNAAIRRILKAISFLFISLIVVFSVAGFGRTDGLAYNQRYFLELVPLAAIALALALDGLGLRIVVMIAGILGSGLLYSLSLMLPSHTWYEIALLRVPLLLALVFIGSRYLLRNGKQRFFLALFLGLCLGWSFLGHTIDDMSASRNRRLRNAAVAKTLESVVPEHSALFTYGGWRDAAGVLWLSRKAVVVDVGADDGADAGLLAEELRHQGRKIFVISSNFPASAWRAIARDSARVAAKTNLIVISELIPGKGGAL